MKKKIWIPAVLVLLAALWLGAAWFSGKRIETELNNGITRMNEAWYKAGPQFQPQIKPISYERGLLSTQARYAFAISTLPDDRTPEIDVTIWHGPFAHGLAPSRFALHAELVATGSVKSMIDAMMKGLPPLVIDARCSYGGHCIGTGNVPAIDYAPADTFKLTFGGVQMQYDMNWHSETDYQGNFNAQFLPLAVNGQSFGSGQIAATGSAQNVTETLSWKTDQGESKLTLAMAMTRPLPRDEIAEMKPAERLNLIASLVKEASFNTSLSKPMLVDIGARAMNLAQGTDVAAARQQISAQLDAFLASDPKVQQFVQIQGNAITSDWRYADDKLTINGQDNTEKLAQMKRLLQMAMQLQAQRSTAAPVVPAQP